MVGTCGEMFEKIQTMTLKKSNVTQELDGAPDPLYSIGTPPTPMLGELCSVEGTFSFDDKTTAPYLDV